MSKNKAFLIFILIFISGMFFHLLSSAEEQFKYDPKGKRNPFIPIVTSDGKFLKLESEEDISNKELVLQGIIYDKSGLSFAIVNGAVVKTGDMVEGYQILKIEKSKIIFIKDGQLSEVRLKKGDE